VNAITRSASSPERTRQQLGEAFALAHRQACFSCGEAEAVWSDWGISNSGAWIVCVVCAEDHPRRRRDLRSYVDSELSRIDREASQRGKHRLQNAFLRQQRLQAEVDRRQLKCYKCGAEKADWAKVAQSRSKGPRWFAVCVPCVRAFKASSEPAVTMSGEAHSMRRLEKKRSSNR
jgi:transcription elongation factor Elf1